MNHPTNRSRRAPAFDPERQWLVAHGHIVEGLDCREFSQHCCERAAEERRRYLYASGRLNITIERQRAIPTKGANGGWRVDPGAQPKHNCSLAPLIDVDEWHLYATDNT